MYKLHFIMNLLSAQLHLPRMQLATRCLSTRRAKAHLFSFHTHTHIYSHSGRTITTTGKESCSHDFIIRFETFLFLESIRARAIKMDDNMSC